MQQHEKLKVATIVNGPFVENCYVAIDSNSRQSIVIDPGSEAQRILRFIEEQGLTVQRIINTHAHIDHVGAVAPLRQALAVPFAIHPAELPVLNSVPMQGMMFGLGQITAPTVDEALGEESKLLLGDQPIDVRHTPGHTPGGVSLFFPMSKIVFVGDTLFAGSIGRTDLPGGNHEQLLASIRTKLLTLDDDTVVYCGHGQPTTIGEERNSNPFLA
jgi:glyoxylase-like metal-dependent hydrolase (beta-lactamase superfamily II)